MMIQIRRKLIMWLAGGMPVIANVHTKGLNIIIYHGDNMMMANVTIEGSYGTAVKIQDKGERAGSILSLQDGLSRIYPQVDRDKAPVFGDTRSDDWAQETNPQGIAQEGRKPNPGQGCVHGGGQGA